ESKRAIRASAGSTLPRVLETQRALLDGARQKLIELGMTEQQLRELDRTQQARSRIYISAPIGGTVIERLATEGQYIKAGQPIYRVVDLSTVWLMLKLFPEDAANIRDGQRVEMEVQSLPGRRFSGRVAFIDPRVDPKTRTVAVRVVMSNEDGMLRPGDYATARIEVDESISGRDVLVIPRSAVLLAGDNSVVYVETEPGRFEIRLVVLGLMTEDQAVIVEGIKPGEEVAISGNFLIDSQMQLSGNPSVIDPSRAKIRQQKKKGPLELEKIEVEALAGRAGVDLERLYEAYFQVQAALAADRSVPAKQATALLSAARSLLQSGDVPGDVKSLVQVVADNTDGLADKEIAEARLSFKPISKSVIQLAARARGTDARRPFLHFYCSMVKGGQGDWLQPNKPLANPYRGSKMLRCGKQVHQLPVATRSEQRAVR
ncbi:MAG: efflux RND transporter periplasmic adaptor subunit, partial [Planctomycetes bacterium]|nr:efflux RND transporter periplasmic adaptor subunit [Planctomycetota bacterium]